MDDTVSRQAVLNVLDEIEAQYVFDDGHDRLLQYAKNKVAALPCEYPTPLETIHCTNEQIERLRNTILNALHEPTVVRCGKCKYLTDTVSEFDPELHLCAFGLWMEQTFFAARATTARRQCQEYMRCRSEVNRMDDLISRQAAIDAIRITIQGQ